MKGVSRMCFCQAHGVCLYVSFSGVQKAGLHLQTNGVQEPNMPATAPPNLQPFFFTKDSSLDQTTSPLPIKVGR